MTTKPAATVAASKIRADIKAAIRTGDLTLPEGATISVRRALGSMYADVIITVKNVPARWLDHLYAPRKALGTDLEAIGRRHWAVDNRVYFLTVNFQAA